MGWPPAPLKFAVMVSGFAALSEAGQRAVKRAVDTPGLLVIGKGDTVVAEGKPFSAGVCFHASAVRLMLIPATSCPFPSERSLVLHEGFSNLRVERHNGGTLGFRRRDSRVCHSRLTLVPVSTCSCCRGLRPKPARLAPLPRQLRRLGRPEPRRAPHGSQPGQPASKSPVASNSKQEQRACIIAGNTKYACAVQPRLVGHLALSRFSHRSALRLLRPPRSRPHRSAAGRVGC